MNIGVDVDDVITNTSDVLIKYIKEKANKNSSELNILIKDVMRGIVPEEYLNEYKKDISTLLDNVLVKDNAKHIISNLRKQGHTIYIITSRKSEALNTDASKFTEKFLIRNNIEFDMLIADAQDKLEECVKYNIDIMIDDSVHICNLLYSNNINALLFNSKLNIDDDVEYRRVDSWNEIENFLI
ncbi:MAG: hypothetical protein RSB76_01370 [Clostridia bacterium]